MELPPTVPSATNIDASHLGYLVVAMTFGAMSAMAALLGSENPLSARVVAAYILAGGLASVGVVLVLVESYGFNYFLCGAGIFAGYKAFDLLAAISIGVSNVVSKFIKKSPPEL
jgi:drug/metabolite transporter (DMT)-like permease